MTTRSDTGCNPLTDKDANRAGKVRIGLDALTGMPNFQSEKTGSTPVGSAMNPLGNLVGAPTVWQFPDPAFSQIAAFASFSFALPAGTRIEKSRTTSAQAALRASEIGG